MNGRIYDPRLGRFLQADPMVQAPKNSQNLNRYSYVLNNPLSYTDPSGYFLKRLFKKWGRVIVAGVAAYFTFGATYAWAANAFANGAAASTSFAGFVSAAGGVSAVTSAAAVTAGATTGFVSGAIIEGNLKGAVKGAFSGSVLAGLGAGLTSLGQYDSIYRGLSGGINGALETGDVEGFARGFLAAQLATDLGLQRISGSRLYYSNQLANFSINRFREYVRGFIIDGKEGARKNAEFGLFNDAAGHLLGLGSTLQAHRKLIAPKFRNGLYYYNAGSSVFGKASAVTIGNVVAAESALFQGPGAVGYSGPLDSHEQQHFTLQSDLGPYYLPLQGMVAGLSDISSFTPIFDCSPFIDVTYDDLGVKRAGGGSYCGR